MYVKIGVAGYPLLFILVQTSFTGYFQRLILGLYFMKKKKKKKKKNVKESHSGRATITKRSLPKAPEEEEVRNQHVQNETAQLK